MELKITPENLTLNVYEGVMSKSPITFTLGQVADAIRTDARIKQGTDAYRFFNANSQNSPQNKKNAVRIKQSMPAFVPAATFYGAHSANAIKGFTGLLALDFDHFSSREALQQKVQEMRQDPHVVMQYVTISGEGLRLVFAIDLDLQSPMESFKAFYAHLSRLYSERVGVEADKQCKDATRLSFMCHDPEAYLNPTPVMFSLSELEEAAMTSKTASTIASTTPSAAYDSTHSNTYTNATQTTTSMQFCNATTPARKAGRPKAERDTERCALEAISTLERSGVRFLPGSHNQFLSDLCYKMNRFGVLEEKTAEWVVMHYAGQSEEYTEENIRRICRSCYRRTEEFDTVRPQFLKNPGRQRARREKSGRLDTREAIFEKVMLYCEVRYNDFKKCTEVRPGQEMLRLSGEEVEDDLLPADCGDDEAMASDGFLPLTDKVINTLLMLLERHDKRVTAKRLVEALTSARPKKFNPVNDYFRSLPKWDGQDRLEQLFNVFHLKYADEPGVRDLLFSLMRKWLIGYVRCSLGRKYNELIWTLIGPQATGKTTFYQWLMPEELKSMTAMLHKEALGTKDTCIALSENTSLLLDECSDMDEAMCRLLNEYTTMELIKERRPYDRMAEVLQRHASLFATGNKANFIRLSTGSRRWLVMHLASEIRRADLEAIDKRQLYAQLLDLARTKASHFPTQQEVKALTAYNFLHCKSLELTLFQQKFRKPEAGEVGEWFSREQVMSILAPNNYTYRLSIDMVGYVLESMGAEKSEVRGVEMFLLYRMEMKELQSLAAQMSAEKAEMMAEMMARELACAQAVVDGALAVDGISESMVGGEPAVADDARECIIDGVSEGVSDGVSDCGSCDANGVENEIANVVTSEGVNALEGTGANTRREDGLSDDLVGAQSSVGLDIQE
jgi:hypothetical protein